MPRPGRPFAQSRPQGRAIGTCAREAVSAPPGHVAAWLGPSRSAEDGRRAGTRRLDGAGSMARLRLAHSSVITPTGSRGRPSTPPDRPTCVSGSRRRNTVLASEKGLNDAALVRQPHAGHLLRIDPRRRRAVLPALSRAAGSHMTHEPEACWILVVGAPRSACLTARGRPGQPGERRPLPARRHFHHSSDPEDARGISRGRLWRERHAR